MSRTRQATRLQWETRGQEGLLNVDTALREEAEGPDDVYCICLEPDDEGYFYLYVNDHCREGDWRKSVPPLKRLAETYAQRQGEADPPKIKPRRTRI